MLSEIIRGGDSDDKDNDYFGPAGLRGRGSSSIETREHDYGILSGSIAVNADFHPVKDLDTLVRQLASVETVPTEEAAVAFIVSITEMQRHAAVAIMVGVDQGVQKTLGRLREFGQFFSSENAQVLRAFGESSHNAQGFGVDFELSNGRASMTFWQNGAKCALQYAPSSALTNFIWP